MVKSVYEKSISTKSEYDEDDWDSKYLIDVMIDINDCPDSWVYHIDLVKQAKQKKIWERNKRLRKLFNE